MFLLLSNRWLVSILSWEGLGIRSFFLINYYQSWDSYNNSLVTILTIRLGDFMFFIIFSIILIFKLNVLLDFFFYFFILVITKSAQFPFSGWLPKAISAPTPTSALVHSSTLVLAGLVLLMIYREIIYRVSFLLIITLVGYFTIFFGSVMAIGEMRIKKVVAFSTLSQIGLGMITFGLGNINVGFFNLIIHGFSKSLLFMQVGYLIHRNYNQQDIRKVNSNMVNGFLRFHLIITLFSLCGLSYTSGISTKESLLDMLFLNNFFFIFMFSIVIAVFLTFIYCYLIYISLLSLNNICYINISISFTILFVISLEFFFVVFYFFWLNKNFLFIKFGFTYLELFFGIIFPLFLFFFVFLFYYIFSLFNYNVFFNIFSNIFFYKWFKYLFNFLGVELLNFNFNYIIFYFFNLIGFYYLKLNLSNSKIFLLFILFVFFLFV